QEIVSKAKRWIIMLTSYSFISCGQHLGTFITVFVLALTQKEKIPNLNFFAMIALFRELSEKLCLCLPTSISYITNVRAAFQRMESFLQRNDSSNFGLDSKRSVQINIIKNIPDTAKKVSVKTPLHDPPYLSLHEVTCRLPSRVSRQSPESNCTEILKDITFNVATPGLVLVCGPVGSGKSSLLSTVLGGELLVTNGFVKYSGTLAYVSDTPWVFSGTIRENILFGLPYNEKLYAEVITACQLEKDFKTFPQNDLALIGEHGATVSGGQRTRIALARATYSQADIYLLDDPLSSLDVNVAENVFRNCIRGLLSSKIVLLTTHDTRYYQEADHIIHLAETECLMGTRREVKMCVYKEYFLYGVSAIVLFIVFLVFYSGQ
ncbi:multidrug resistance-associated 4-like, partial [Paramuricea clavata]